MSRRIFVRLALVATFVLIPLLYALRSRPYDAFDGSIDIRELSEGTVSGAKGALQRVFRSGSSANPPRQSEVESWVDLDNDMPLTTYDGGIPGYTVWSNLYLSDGAFVVIEPDKPSDQFGRETLPNPRQILSSAQRNAAEEDRWRVAGQEVAKGDFGSRANVLRGVTFVFNDAPGPEGYLVYFGHFALEAFIGAARALASTLTRDPRFKATPNLTPSRIWFPRCGSSPSWRDDKGLNVWFLSHVLPGAVIEDATAFEDRVSAGVPILLEKVVIVDRWAAHSVGGEVQKWGKMNSNLPSLKAPDNFWQPYRNNAVRALGVDGYSRFGSRGLPVVVYIDRQKDTPRLPEADHLALIEELKTLTPKAEVHVTKLSSMSRVQQIELMSRAEIIIGCKGEELMSSLWMKQSPTSTVIELFEEGGFNREFGVVTTALGHNHIAVQRHRVLEEQQWREIGNKAGPNPKEVRVDPVFLVGIIEEILDWGVE